MEDRSRTASSGLKAALWIGLGVAVTLCVVAAVLLGAWVVWERTGWGMHGFGTRGTGAGVTTEVCPWDDGNRRPWGLGWGPRRGALCTAPGTPESGSSEASELTLEEAEAAFERYLTSLGYDDLQLSEVMAFEHNFYAIAEETDTGIGAMELLLDKESGSVSPEIGPNMMWNAKYGMHGGGRGMMGWRADLDNTLTDHEALEIAQDWLTAHRPGVTTEEHADAFYGYYTIHTLQDGEIEGMLSVHGDTGQVWYHSWHGDFIAMRELAHDEGHED